MMIALLILTWIYKANGWMIPATVWVVEVGIAIVQFTLGILGAATRKIEQEDRRNDEY